MLVAPEDHNTAFNSIMPLSKNLVAVSLKMISNMMATPAFSSP